MFSSGEGERESGMTSPRQWRVYQRCLGKEKRMRYGIRLLVKLGEEFDGDGPILTFASGFGFDVSHSVKRVVDDASLVRCHRIEFDVNVAFENVIGGSLGQIGEAGVLVFFVAANIEKDPIAVTELVAYGETIELIEGLKRAAVFPNKDGVTLTVDGDVDDVLFD